MYKLKVDDGRLIRAGWPKRDYGIDLTQADCVHIYVTSLNLRATAMLRPTHYKTEWILLKYALRGFLDRVGGPADDPAWLDMFQRFVAKWCWNPIKYQGHAALLQKMSNGANLFLNLRQADDGRPAVVVHLSMEIGQLIHHAEQTISANELHPMGIRPLPLGRDPKAVYNLLSYILRKVRHEAWTPNDMVPSLRNALRGYGDNAGLPYLDQQYQTTPEIVTGTGTDQAEPEVREWEGVMGNT